MWAINPEGEDPANRIRNPQAGQWARGAGGVGGLAGFFALATLSSCAGNG